MGYCYHPLKGFYIGDNASGKRKFKVTDFKVDHLERYGEEWRKVYDSFISYEGKYKRPHVSKYIEIPCGQCIGCRLQRSREWANRLMMELESHKEAIFLTLTYNDENIRYFDGVNPVTGEIVKTAGLCLEDLQKFIKDLRNHERDIKIRYFACGEYGDLSNRPHYHLIIFGWSPKDPKFYKQANGYSYYTSDFISSIWPYGYNVLAGVTWESCAYTARYVVKKLNGDAGKMYEDLGIKPPFVIMSTKPGIAHDYFVNHREMFSDEQKVYYLSTKYGSVSFSKPRYFKKLEDISELIPLDASTLIKAAQEHFNDTSDAALEQEQNRKLISFQTDMDYLEELSSQEINKNAQIRSLKRKEF